ncbi:MAG: hypothetical protein WC745_00190 [Patescibacteria group bacterium]|jgi:hypothetical protein
MTSFSKPFKKIFSVFSFKRLFWALFYVFLFCLLLNNSFSYLDPDLGWHLKAGEDILREKSVPHLNYYNYTLEGKTWVDHEWLLNLVAFLIYSLSGNMGLNILFALLALAALAALHVFAKKSLIGPEDSPGNVFLTVFFLIFGVIAASPHLGVRMQEIALLCVSLLYAILYRYDKKRDLKILFALPLLFYFWASAHASFLIGLFLLFFRIVIMFLKNILIKYFPGSRVSAFFGLEALSDKKRISPLIALSGLSVGATLLTPYGLELYGFLSDYGNTFYMTHIAEWLPAWYLPIAYWQMAFMAFALAGFLLYFLNKNKKEKPGLWEVSIFFLFMALAFKSKRHFPLFFFSSLPLILKSYASVLRPDFGQETRFGGEFREIKTSARSSFFSNAPKFPRAMLLITIAFVSLSLLLKTNFAGDSFQYFCRDYPCGATAFLKANPQYENLNLFNEYAWGGYLIWTYPEKKLFIDGRLPQLPFKNHTFLEEYFELLDKDKLAAKLNEYDIRLVLIRAEERKIKFNFIEKKFFGLDEEKENKDKNELAEFLKSSGDWENVYQDQTAAVYLKK